MPRSCRRIEGSSRVALDQIVATRGDCSKNIRAAICPITSNNAVLHLIVTDSINVTTRLCCIAINGTKFNGCCPSIVNTTAVYTGYVARNGAVGKFERAAVVDTATASASLRSVVRDSAVSDDECTAIVDAATASASLRSVVRD